MCLEMTRRGFVSVSIEYPEDYSIADLGSKTDAVMGGNASASEQLCQQIPSVDCRLGLAVSGIGQGGQIAQIAAKYDPRVTAVLVLGAGLPASYVQGGPTILHASEIDQLL